MRMSVEGSGPHSPHPYLLTYLSAHLSLGLRTYPLHMGERGACMRIHWPISRHNVANTLRRGQRFQGLMMLCPIIVIIGLGRFGVFARGDGYRNGLSCYVLS